MSSEYESRPCFVQFCSGRSVHVVEKTTPHVPADVNILGRKYSVNINQTIIRVALNV